MDAPLTFNGQQAWTNTPEAWAEIERTSKLRALRRDVWRALNREALDALAGR